MKRCPKCNEYKPAAEFCKAPSRHDGLNSHCLVCQNLLLKERAHRLQERIVAHKVSHGCMECGERNPDLLEFDHRDPTRKTMNIGKAAWKWGWPRIRAEIAQCDVRCVTCHRRRTAEQREATGNWGTRRAAARVEMLVDEQLALFPQGAQA